MISNRGLLESLLWDCFEGPNECRPDQGLTAAIETPPTGSVVLAFHLDGKRFRAACGLDQQGKKCCDSLLAVVHKRLNEEPRLTFLLIEMKGRDLGHAMLQLGDTIEALRSNLPRERTRLIAVIVSDRAASMDLPRSEMERFRREHRASIFVRTGVRNEAPADLSDLLKPRAPHVAEA